MGMYILGASCLGVGVGSIGAHYFFNREMSKKEAVTIGSRNAVNFFCGFILSGIASDAANPHNIPELNNSAMIAEIITFLFSVIVIGKAIGAFHSKDIENAYPSKKYAFAVGLASTTTAIVCGYVTMCLVHKK